MRTTDPPASLGGFPDTVLPTGATAHRVFLRVDPGTGRARSPIHYATVPAAGSPGGRYDLPAPHGTCYLAERLLTCLVEVTGDDLAVGVDGTRLLAEPFLRRRRAVTVTADVDVGPLADLDADAAFGYGVAGDVHTTDDRDLTQRWAAALHGSGRMGIRGHARTPPSGSARTTSLFGAAGPTSGIDGATVSAPRELHTDTQLLAALRDHGIEVVPVPTRVQAT